MDSLCSCKELDYLSEGDGPRYYGGKDKNRRPCRVLTNQHPSLEVPGRGAFFFPARYLVVLSVKILDKPLLLTPVTDACIC